MTRRKTIEEVRKSFEEGGCVLLSTEYVNNTTKLDYICECGETSQIAWAHFARGHRCTRCYRDKLSEAAKRRGSGVPKRRRDLREDRQWRGAVFERDDYTCLKCGKRGVELNAHHLKAFFLHEEDRYDVDNGVTLCQPCHTIFHQTYGYKDFKPEDTGKFIKEV